MAEQRLVMSLDVATKCGVAEGFPGEAPKLYTVDFGREDDDLEDVLGRALYWFSNRLLTNVPAHIGIEKPVPGFAAGRKGKTNHNTLTVLPMLFGIMVAVAKCKGIRIYPAPISSWRSHFFGKGKGQVDRDTAKMLARHTCTARGWTFDGEDAAEAGGIWDWTCAQAYPPERLKLGRRA